MAELVVRPGGPADLARVLDLFDEAARWLVARGQTGQWGAEPPSDRPATRRRVERMAAGGGLRIAEREGVAVGAVSVGAAPDYVPRVPQAELYIELLLASRRHAGQGIGAHLIAVAREIARAGDAEVLRVDCWAGAPGLVRWYERQGFRPAGTFAIEGWTGQILAMAP